MDPDKFEESVRQMELVLRSLENILDGISRNDVSHSDLENVREGLSLIHANVRSCL